MSGILQAALEGRTETEADRLASYARAGIILVREHTPAAPPAAPTAPARKPGRPRGIFGDLREGTTSFLPRGRRGPARLRRDGLTNMLDEAPTSIDEPEPKPHDLRAAHRRAHASPRRGEGHFRPPPRQFHQHLWRVIAFPSLILLSKR